MADHTKYYTLIELCCHKKPITNCKFSYDSIYLMSSGQDGTICLWNPSLSTPLIKSYKNLLSNQIIDFSIAKDNSKFLCCGSDKDSYLIDSQSSKIIRRFHGHTDTINSISFNDDETLLVTGSLDMSVKIFDVNNRDLIQSLPEAKDSITHVAFINNKVYASSVDEVLRVYDIRKGELTSCTFNSAINSFDVSFGEKLIAVSCMDSEVKLYDAAKEKIIKTMKGMHQCKNYMMKICIDAEDNGIMVNSEDGRICYYDFVSDAKDYYVRLNDKVTTCLDVNRIDKRSFASGSSDSKLIYWKVKY